MGNNCTNPPNSQFHQLNARNDNDLFYRKPNNSPHQNLSNNFILPLKNSNSGLEINRNQGIFNNQEKDRRGNSRNEINKTHFTNDFHQKKDYTNDFQPKRGYNNDFNGRDRYGDKYQNSFFNDRNDFNFMDSNNDFYRSKSAVPLDREKGKNFYDDNNFRFNFKEHKKRSYYQEPVQKYNFDDTKPNQKTKQNIFGDSKPKQDLVKTSNIFLNKTELSKTESQQNLENTKFNNFKEFLVQDNNFNKEIKNKQSMKSMISKRSRSANINPNLNRSNFDIKTKRDRDKNINYLLQIN